LRWMLRGQRLLRHRQRYSDAVASRRRMERELRLDFLRWRALPEPRSLLDLPSSPSGCKREGCGRRLTHRSGLSGTNGVGMSLAVSPEGRVETSLDAGSFLTYNRRLWNIYPVETRFSGRILIPRPLDRCAQGNLSTSSLTIFICHVERQLRMCVPALAQSMQLQTGLLHVMGSEAHWRWLKGLLQTVELHPDEPKSAGLPTPSHHRQR